MCLTLQELQELNWDVGNDPHFVKRRGFAFNPPNDKGVVFSFNDSTLRPYVEIRQASPLFQHANQRAATALDNGDTTETRWRQRRGYVFRYLLQGRQGVNIHHQAPQQPRTPQQQMFKILETFWREIQRELAPAGAVGIAEANVQVPAAPPQTAPAGKKTGSRRKTENQSTDTEAFPEVSVIEEQFIRSFNESLKAWGVAEDWKERLKIPENGQMDNTHPLFNIFYTLPGDIQTITDYNKKCGNRKDLIYRYFPQEGICGNPETAKILIFSNNPGATGFWDNAEKQTIPHVIQMLQENFESGHAFTGVLAPLPGEPGWKKRSFAPLYDTYINFNDQAQTTNYWANHLLGAEGTKQTFLLSYENIGLSREKILRKHRKYIMTLELFSYHTERFNMQSLRDQFGEHVEALKSKINTIINNAIERKKILLFARYAKWQGFLGEDRMRELEDYEYFFRLSSPSNTCVSRNNVTMKNKNADNEFVKDGAFEKLLAQYKKLTQQVMRGRRRRFKSELLKRLPRGFPRESFSSSRRKAVRLKAASACPRSR